MLDRHGVLLDLGTIDRGDMDLAPLLGTCNHWEIYQRTQPGELLDRVRQAEALVSNKVVLDGSTLSAAKRLRLVCIAATGTNNVDLAAARALGVAVTNVVGYATASVVQHVFGLILTLTTRILDHRSAVLEGAWTRSGQFCLLDFPIQELAGRTLRIVGFGELGRRGPRG